MSKNSLGKCFQFQKNRCLFTHLSALFVVDIKFYYTGARKQSIYFEIHWDFLCSQILIIFISVWWAFEKSILFVISLYVYADYSRSDIYGDYSSSYFSDSFYHCLLFVSLICPFMSFIKVSCSIYVSWVFFACISVLCQLMHELHYCYISLGGCIFSLYWYKPSLL